VLAAIFSACDPESAAFLDVKSVQPLWDLTLLRRIAGWQSNILRTLMVMMKKERRHQDLY